MNFQKYLIVSACLIALPPRSVAGEKRCLGVPNDGNPVIEACEYDDSYVFKLPSGDRAFDKLETQSAISRAVTQWWTAQGFDLIGICGKNVAYWVSVPESTPDSAAARIIVETDHGALLFSGPLDPMAFTAGDGNSAVFATGSYPTSYGARAKSLLVKASPAANADELQSLVSLAGGTSLTDVGSNWYRVTTMAFEEAATRNKMLRLDQFSHMLESVSMNQIYEWLAFRRKVFAMHIMCDTE